MNRRGSVLALLASAAAVLTGRKGDAATVKEQRAVFDLTADTLERWDAALRNVENLRKALGAENVEVQVVVHGKAYPLLQALADDGVRLSLCQNTMKRFNVERESLLPFADTWMPPWPSWSGSRKAVGHI